MNIGAIRRRARGLGRLAKEGYTEGFAFQLAADGLSVSCDVVAECGWTAVYGVNADLDEIKWDLVEHRNIHVLMC